VISDTIVLDIDTQWDLVMPEGAWPAPGAFGLIPNFERVSRYAHTYKLRRVATTQLLDPADPRFVDKGGDLPPHCLVGTPGARKIPGTQPTNPVVVANQAWSPADLKAHIGESLEIIVETSGPDWMSNPGAAGILSGVRNAIVFGVGGEGAVMVAVRSLLAKGITVEVVRNAVALRSVEPEARERWEEEIQGSGARLIRDMDVMTRFTTARHH